MKRLFYFKRQKKEQPVVMPKPDFSENWKDELYNKHLKEGIEALRQGKPILLHEDNRGFELACDIKRGFILEYSRQLAQRVNINHGGGMIEVKIKHNLQ